MLRWRMFTGETGQLHPQKNGAWIGMNGRIGDRYGNAAITQPEAR